uniref:probable disease resistance protein At4g27220 n=1 Tax=Erigeron canadensis TaxID=72917 RepID=UPI001CB9C27C|nr:probable disease resistance protein At4g27220 [Erigeron canadensis]
MAEQVSSTVIGKVVDSLFCVIKKETGYMWNCEDNVGKFKNEVEKLQDMKERVEQQINIAKVEGNNLIVGVEKWVEEAAQEISKAQEFLQQEANAKKTCFKIGMCGNWATRHRYGKMVATKMTPCLLEHQERGKDFVTCVSVYTRAPGPLDVYQNKDLDDIVTQNSALEDIIKALEDDNIQIIGIYGLGGVGKTTLAKEVAARVKKSNMTFVDIAFTTVTQTVKAQEIKNDLENAKKRIEKGEKVLIILDDVWEKLDLEDLCIPINHTNCKLLLTSRSEKVCEKMNAQSKIYLDSLPAKEAWILFKRVVGERLETDSNLKPVALKVAQECGGLPLLIQAVGNALKNESMESWNWALRQLQKHAPLDIDDEIRKAFTHLQLSYEHLKSQEAKSCFLICSLFPEDEDIELENLVRYGVGLEKFDDLDSIEDARGRVQNAINILTSSGLLLHTQQEGFTKMHDVVRDVALLIASQGENKYLVKAGKGLTEWLPRENSLKDYTGISLMKNSLSKLPDYKIDLPRLEIFAINDNDYLYSISNELIEGMKEVKVLDMRCPWMKLPQSFKLLSKLHMLNLEKVKYFDDISMLGEMKDLEILILNGTNIKKIPQEIGQLVNLRQLEVTDCEDLSHITPGVISKLWRLEELCIDFRQVREGVYDCVVEVMKLSKLTYLVLKVLRFENGIPHQGFSYAKLKGFLIQIGKDYLPLEATTRSDRYLVLSNYILRISLLKWMKELIEESHPRIFFGYVHLLYDIMPTLSGFIKLKYIRLSDCPDVIYLLDSTSCDWDEKKTPSEKYFMQLQHLRLSHLKWLKVLWKCPDEYISLTNLVNLRISYCKRLVRVLTVGIAQGLVNLKKLKIVGCFRLEEVIRGDGEEIDRGRGGETEEIVEQQHSSANIVILFPSLVKITLFNCVRLKSFFSSTGNGNCSIKYPSLMDVRIETCRSLKKWGPGIHETPKLNRLVGYYGYSHSPILLDGPCGINDAVENNLREWRW